MILRDSGMSLPEGAFRQPTSVDPEPTQPIRRPVLRDVEYPGDLQAPTVIGPCPLAGSQRTPLRLRGLSISGRVATGT